MSIELNNNQRIKKFMQTRAKNIFVAVASVAATFGIVTAGLIILTPQKAVEITKNLAENMLAQATTTSHYALPPAKQSPLAGSADAAFLKSFSKVFTNIAKETRPSLVLIIAEKKVTVAQQNFPNEFFFPFFPPQFGPPNGGQGRKPQPRTETDAGSGFIVDLKSGYVITNNHVIDGADKVTVTTYDNKKYKAKILGTAKNVDIAVLKLIDFKPSAELKEVSLGDSAKVEVGDWVVALGAPFELPQTLTMGVVSALQRTSDSLGFASANSFIQTDAAINPGNSGGPLVGIEGQVIGMNTAIYSKNGTSVGIGFAIPANTIRIVADSIINNGKLMQAYLGVEMTSLDKFGSPALKEMGIDPSTTGGLIMKVVPNSPAAKAGLQPYDIIQSVDGDVTNTPSDIQRHVMFLKPDTKVKLGILRNNKKIVLNATVVELPSSKKEVQTTKSQDDDSDQSESIASQFGISFSDKIPDNKKGVLIGSVQPNTLADLNGLQAGDLILSVNNKEVNSAKDMEKVLKNAKDANSSVLLLLVERDGVRSALIFQIN